jgi:DNA (cytosine-5)-methyltransferase 1
MNELALFAGAGGGILGGTLLGWRTICAVEQNKYAASVLAARQNDGILAPFPIWDDVCTFDGRPWRGIVDVISGGFPCQDISIAGKGAGIEGDRSGLWKEFARIISEVRPRYVFVENSPMLTIRGGERVISDLAALGYFAKWMCLSAADCGAPHKRDRFWLVGNTNDYGQATAQECGSITQGSNEGETGAKQACEPVRPSEQYAELADTASIGGRRELRKLHGANEAKQQSKKQHKNEAEQFNYGSKNGGDTKISNANGSHGERNQCAKRVKAERAKPFINCGWPPEPGVGRVVNGLAARVDRLSALGNGQVPRVAATAWRELNS